MAKQNAYLAKQEAVQRQCFNDGWELGTQQMCDYISLALRDPETMGKDTFSGARILKVLKKTNEKTWLWSGITGGWKELNMMVLNGGSSRPSRKSQDGAATHSAVTLGLERR